MIVNGEKLEAMGETWRKVRPIHRVSNGGSDRTQEYGFSRVYVDDVNEEEITAPTNASYEMADDGLLLYQYGDKPQVLITQEGPYVKEDEEMREGENQAYFALSVLSELGLVGNWGRE